MKYCPSRNESYVHSIAVGLLLCLASWICFSQLSISIACLFGGFGLFSKYADHKRLEFVDSELKKRDIEVKRNRKLIHAEYALKKIAHLRKALSANRVSKSSITYGLYDLENILNQLYRCCSTGDEKEQFKQDKGVVGNLKTQIEISDRKADLKEKYKEFVESLQEMQVFIEEL